MAAVSPASTSATTVGVPMARSYGPHCQPRMRPAWRSYLVAWATRPGRRISRSSPSSARSAAWCTNAASFGRGRCIAPGQTAGTRTIASRRRCHQKRKRETGPGWRGGDSSRTGPAVITTREPRRQISHQRAPVSRLISAARSSGVHADDWPGAAINDDEGRHGGLRRHPSWLRGGGGLRPGAEVSARY
jgi:hypothetical protein